MSRLPVLPALRRLQRRFSFVLATALCLWMLALASHFHGGDYPGEGTQETHALCAFCVSVPNSGAAPAVVAFVVAPQQQGHFVTTNILPTFVAAPISGYYSRGPPLV